jgi:hypothetical protein
VDLCAPLRAHGGGCGEPRQHSTIQTLNSPKLLASGTDTIA